MNANTCRWAAASGLLLVLSVGLWGSCKEQMADGETSNTASVSPSSSSALPEHGLKPKEEEGLARSAPGRMEGGNDGALHLAFQAIPAPCWDLLECCGELENRLVAVHAPLDGATVEVRKACARLDQAVADALGGRSKDSLLADLCAPLAAAIASAAKGLRSLPGFQWPASCNVTEGLVTKAAPPIVTPPPPLPTPKEVLAQAREAADGLISSFAGALVSGAAPKQKRATLDDIRAEYMRKFAEVGALRDRLDPETKAEFDRLWAQVRRDVALRLTDAGLSAAIQRLIHEEPSADAVVKDIRQLPGAVELQYLRQAFPVEAEVIDRELDGR